MTFRYEGLSEKVRSICHVLRFFLYGNNLHTSEVLENSGWLSGSANCFIQQWTLPHLIFKWQRLMCIQNNEQWQSYWQLKEKSQHIFTNVCPSSIVKLLWTWVLCDDGKDRLKEAETQGEELWNIHQVDELTCSVCHITTDELCCAVPIRKGSVMIVIEVLAVWKSVVTEGHEFWGVHTKRQAKQPPLIFCTSAI
jgi:hypothetical protein